MKLIDPQKRMKIRHCLTSFRALRQIAFSAMVCNAARGPVESGERPVFRFRLRPPTAEYNEKMAKRRGSDFEDSSSSWNTDTDEDSDTGSMASTTPVRKLTNKPVVRSGSISAPTRSPKSPGQKLSASIGTLISFTR